MNYKEELIIEAASRVHEDWCLQELHGFWNRARKSLQSGTVRIVDALNQACFKGETKRNELFLDVPSILGHEDIANNCLNDFNDFMIIGTTCICIVGISTLISIIFSIATSVVRRKRKMIEKSLI